ncbi:hypothetical protein Emed_005055 [Eimeria media]
MTKRVMVCMQEGIIATFLSTADFSARHSLNTEAADPPPRESLSLSFLSQIQQHSIVLRDHRVRRTAHAAQDEIRKLKLSPSHSASRQYTMDTVAGAAVKGGGALGGPPSITDPIMQLSLPPPSSLCRFIPHPQTAGGRGSSKRRTASKAGAASSSLSSTKKQRQKPIGIAFETPASASLSKLCPSLLPESLRRHFLPSGDTLQPDRQQAAAQQQAQAAGVRDFAQQATYTARVHQLSPLSVVLLLSLVARLRQRHQQKQQQHVTGSCLLYMQRLASPPPQSLLQQMHAGRPFVCFCCSRRFSTSAAKLVHLEQHMRRRLQQQQQRQGGGRFLASAARNRGAAAAAAKQFWPGVSSWVSTVGSPVSAEASAASHADVGLGAAAETHASAKQQTEATLRALLSLAKAEQREQEALAPPDKNPEGPPTSVQRQYPSWLPPFVAAHLQDPAAAAAAAAATAAAAGTPAASGDAHSGAASGTAAEGGGAASEAGALSAVGASGGWHHGESQQQAADLPSIAANAAQRLQQQELLLWKWCVSAAELEGFDFSWLGGAYPSPATWAPSEGGPHCVAATPQQWAAALRRLAAAVAPEAAAAAAAAAAPSKGGEEATGEAAERLLLAVRQHAAATAAAAKAAAAVSPARMLMQEAERFRRCHLCDCDFALSLDEQQQQFYSKDAVAVLLQQQSEQQQLADAIVEAVTPAIRRACGSSNSSSSNDSSSNDSSSNDSSINNNMELDVHVEQGAAVTLRGLEEAAATIASLPVLRLAALNPMDACKDSPSKQQEQQQQQQQQQPRYVQLSSRIGAQPAALSVADEVEAAVLLQQTEEGAPAAAAASAAAATAGGRAACAADAAAAEAAYRSLVSMEMTDGELEPLQQEMLALLRQQLPDRKQQEQRAANAAAAVAAAAAAAAQQQKKDGGGGLAAAAAATDLTVERLLPADTLYVHCDCYQQHLQRQGAFFRLLLLLLLLRCAQTHASEKALATLGRLLLQSLKQQKHHKGEQQPSASGLLEGSPLLPSHPSGDSAPAFPLTGRKGSASRSSRRRF